MIPQSAIRNPQSAIRNPQSALDYSRRMVDSCGPSVFRIDSAI